MENIEKKAVPQMGTIMDAVAQAPENFEEKQENMQAALDNHKMMEAIARYKAAHTPKIKEYKIGRNDPCPCGSGKKYKNCCLSSGKYENYTIKSKNE